MIRRKPFEGRASHCLDRPPCSWSRNGDPCANERNCSATAGLAPSTGLEVLQALLWGFHGAKSGLCFPSYEKIAAAACCARSTVYEAIRALEDAGILTWVNRIKRVKERCVDLLGDQGWRWRVLRTSNAYTFRDPSPSAERPNPSKSEKETGTENPVLDSSLFAALDRLKEAFERAVAPTVSVKQRP